MQESIPKVLLINDFIKELRVDRNRNVESSDKRQPLHIHILNKFGSLLFSIERVENNNTCQSETYYEDVLIDLDDIEFLKSEYPTEWTLALKRAVTMYFDTALNNIDTSDQKQKDFFFNQAIYALTYCKSINSLKEKYYDKIEH